MEMMKLNIKVKKMVAIIMLAIIFYTSIPISIFAKYITDMNSNAYFGIISGSLDEYGHQLHYANYNDTKYMVFCCQFGKTSPDGREYVYNKDFQIQFNNDRKKYKKIAQYIYFGYTMKYGSGLPKTDEAKKAVCATQQFVWEYIKDNINANYGAPSRNSWNSKYMSSSIYSDWLSKTENYYKSYNNTNVSFNNKTKKVNIGESKTFNDSNGVLESYPSFNKNINGVNFKHEKGNNKIVVSVDSNCDAKTVKFSSNSCDIYRLLPNGATYNSGEMSNYMYFRFTSGAVQNLMFSNYVDPNFFNFSIEIQSGKVELEKTNNIGDLIADCTFDIYSDENCKNKINSATTRSDGKIVFDKLKPGTYYIKETNVAEGYLIDDTIKKIDVVNGETAKVEFKNSEPTGTIKIIKRDSETGAIPQGDAKLENAIYKVYANEDIYNVAKTKKHYSKDDLVATVTTNEKGEIEDVTNLPLGKYFIKEEKASVGYLVDENIYEVNLTYKDQHTKIITSSITSNEDVKKMKVHIFKSGIKENSDEVPGLEGVEFSIKLYADIEKALKIGYSYEEIWNGLNEYGEKIDVDEKRVAEAQKIAPTIERIVTDETGNAYTVNKLPYGRYLCKETFTPDSFYAASDFTFSITDDESEVIEVAKKVKHLIINNEQMETYIKLVKKDKKSGKNVTLNSATFQIKASEDIYDRGNGKIIYKKGEIITQKVGSTVYNSFTTNADNVVVVDESYTNNKEDKSTVTTPLLLPVGEYEVHEVSTPAGFLKLESPIKFKVNTIKDYDKDATGDYIKEVVITNEQPVGTLIINKSVTLKKDIDTSLVDISDLSKIQFRLVAKENIIDMSDNSIIYAKGQEINTYNLSKEGKLIISEIPMGCYEFYECATLEGLVLDDTKYEVIFEQKDDITKVYTETKEITNDTMVTEISKTDITGEKELVGAELVILDENENVIDTWISTENVHKIEGLTSNKKYILRENLAPIGFVKSSDIEFKLDDKKNNQKVTMIDKVLGITKTDLTNGKEIEGAKLVLTDEDGNIIDEWESTKEVHIISGVEENKTYTLAEETAPYRI